MQSDGHIILINSVLEYFFPKHFLTDDDFILDSAIFFSLRSENNVLFFSDFYNHKLVLQQFFLLIRHNEGLALEQKDSYMLGDSDLSPFQHRVLDTDAHFISPSTFSTRFFVNALDVLHSFTILGTGVKVDAIVGRVNDMTMFLLRDGLL